MAQDRPNITAYSPSAVMRKRREKTRGWSCQGKRRINDEQYLSGPKAMGQLLVTELPPQRGPACKPRRTTTAASVRLQLARLLPPSVESASGKLPGTASHHHSRWRCYHDTPNAARIEVTRAQLCPRAYTTAGILERRNRGPGGCLRCFNFPHWPPGLLQHSTMASTRSHVLYGHSLHSRPIGSIR